MISRNDPCWCGSGSKWKKCHFPHPPPLLPSSPKNLAQEYFKKYQIILKNEKQQEAIRQACHLASEILMALCREAKVGVTTAALDRYSMELHRQAGAIPAALHYGSPPFPKGICTSLNEVICHGIPDERPLEEGDILNIDVAVILNGFYGDCSRMVVLGSTSPERQRVVDVSYECLMQAIEVLKPGQPIYKIAEVIERHAQAKGCSVVNQFVGHGVGIAFHEAPQIPHHLNHLAIPLAPGMIFTIEPMINAGVREAVIDRHNKWTARTKDGRASAQWEHTLLITEEGHEILTPWVR